MGLLPTVTTPHVVSLSSSACVQNPLCMLDRANISILVNLESVFLATMRTSRVNK